MMKGQHLEKRNDLTSVEIQRAELTEFGAHRIGQGLIANKSVTSLILDFNPFGSDGAAGLCKGLTMNTTLSVLSLNYCGIGPEGAEAIGMALSTAPWEELHLNGNPIGGDGAAYLAKGLAHNSNLKLLSLQVRTLDFSFNK